MCGICGIVSFDAPPDLSVLRRMTGRLAHRGPDGNGYFRDAQAALGHARLAIIDTAGGSQPLCNEDGTLWITFNGEIFNYLELAEELRRRGHVFRTASDTEVIVHGWEEWGEDCLTRFNGQWAFALWDRSRQTLVLARDRLGVRPLFFARHGRSLVFASEIKSLFEDESVPREFDPAGIDQVLTYWSTVASRTVFRGVEQLEPGHYAVFDAAGLRTHSSWTPTFPERGKEPLQDIAENVQALREGLVSATRLRFLRSDVPVAAYLSGGIDSAVTASVIARYTDAPLHTFSLRFSDQEFDEGGFQAVMARELGTEHHDVVVSTDDIADVFPDVVRHAETPLLRSAPAPMFLLSRLVSENGFKVVVTGEGADEVLAGYDIFREARVRRFLAVDPASEKRRRALELVYPWMATSPGRFPAIAASFFGRTLDPSDPAFSHRPRWDSTATLKHLLSAEMRAETSGADPDEIVNRMPAAAGDWDPLSRDQWLEMMTLLPGYILASQGDRMLMANSVEGRFPFLDKDVVELAAALPARHKLFGLEEKYLLKRAFADLVPQQVLERDKQPYRAPDAITFFGGRTPPWLEQVTTETAVKEAGVFDPALVAGLFMKSARRRGRGMSNTDNMSVLAVISTQVLHQQLLSSDRPSVPDLPTPTVAVDLLTNPGSV
jgi:asparagine synthase (glutamine-hydrolysing)